MTKPRSAGGSREPRAPRANSADKVIPIRTNEGADDQKKSTVSPEQFERFIKEAGSDVAQLTKKKGFTKAIVELAARAELDVDDEHNKEALQAALGRLKKAMPAKILRELEAGVAAQELNLDEMLLELARRQSSLSHTLEGFVPPEGEKGVDAFAQYLNRVLERPDSGLGTESPFAARLMARLQEVPTPAAVPLYPKGSPASSQVERVGGRLAGEWTLSYMELSIFSVTITKAAAAFGVALSTPVAIGLALAACTTMIFPGRNEFFKYIIQNDGNVMKAMKQFAKEKPRFAIGTAILIGGVAIGGVAYAIDKSFEDGMKSSAAGEALGRAVEGEQPGQGIIERMETNDTMPAFVRRVPAIVDALLRAERFPNERAQIQAEFGDVLTPGGTGNEGIGPVYAARCLLFGRPIPAETSVNSEHRALIEQARLDAGFRSGETLEAFVARQHREYMAATEAARTRAIELTQDIAANRDRLAAQNTGTIFVGSVLHFEGSMSQEEALAPRAELEEQLRLIEVEYVAMQTQVTDANRILSSASEQIAPGTGLTLSLPPFTLNEVFQPLFDLELDNSHPVAEQWAAKIAEVSGGEPEQYYTVARSLIGGTSGLAALILALGMLPLFYGGALKRNRIIREREKHHLGEAKDTEDAYVDRIVEEAKFLQPYIPGNPEITPFRARFALRQLIMSKSAVLLGDDTKMLERFTHWFKSNYLERGKVTDDTEGLKDFIEVLRKIQKDPKFSEELLETLYPGFSALTKALGNDQELILRLASGGKLNEEEALRLKEISQSPEQFASKVNKAQLECAYATAQAERHALESEYTCLSKILEDVMTGANNFKIFNPFTNEEDLHLESRNMAEAINTYGYTYTIDGTAPQISEEHQRVMRRVAEETQAAKVIMMMMAENRTRMGTLDKDLDKIQRAFITRQMKEISKNSFNLSIPKSMLDGDDPAVRELLTSSAGAFEDVAKDVKKRLSGLDGLANDGRGVDDSIAEIVEVLSSSRGGLDEDQVTHITEMLQEVKRYGEEAAKTPEKTKIYSVQQQLDAMAQRLFNSQALKDLTDDLNYGRARGEELSVDLTVVYDLKAQELPEDGSKIDVPGCIFRFRVLDASNGEMIANDFQMSHVLLKEREPKVSADRFSIWLKGAIKNAKLEARKEWLSRFVEGDSEKEKEGVLTLGLMENPMRTADWLDTFYSRTVLKWKRAEVARALQGATSPIKTDALEIFSQEADRQGIVHDSVAKEAMVTEIVTLRRQLPVWDRTKVVLNLATQRVTRSVGKPRELTIAQYAAELRRKAGA